VGKPLSLTAADAHKLGAYRADRAGKSRGGVVVVQEIFGVNHHIRSVSDRLNAESAAIAWARAIRLLDQAMGK
jgi:carboxymethylenebutenolidase